MATLNKLESEKKKPAISQNLTALAEKLRSIPLKKEGRSWVELDDLTLITLVITELFPAGIAAINFLGQFQATEVLTDSADLVLLPDSLPSDETVAFTLAIIAINVMLILARTQLVRMTVAEPN
jgi:hypothetical protein